MSNTEALTAPPGDIRWVYEEPQHRGATMFLLTTGRVALKGPWTGRLGEFFIAYCPMPKRDKAREEELINQGVIPRY